MKELAFLCRVVNGPIRLDPNPANKSGPKLNWRCKQTRKNPKVTLMLQKNKDLKVSTDIIFGLQLCKI